MFLMDGNYHDRNKGTKEEVDQSEVPTRKKKALLIGANDVVVEVGQMARLSEVLNTFPPLCFLSPLFSQLRCFVED